MEKVLITGAAGFVGHKLANHLIDKGFYVRLFDLESNPNFRHLQSQLSGLANVEFFAGDITCPTDVYRATEGIHYVFHAAALLNSIADYQTFYNVNVLGTQNIASAALHHQVTRFTLISTSDVFGIPRPGEIINEHSPYRPWNEPYADTKIKACEVVKSFQNKGLPVTIIYPGWVYGPGDRQFFPAVMDMVREGHVFLWHKDKPYEIDLIYIDDLIAAIENASFSEAGLGEDFLILDAHTGLTPQRFFEFVSGRLGVSIKTHKIPYSAMMLVAHVSQWLARKKIIRQHLLSTTDVKAFGNDFNFTTEKAKNRLNWSPKTSVADGLEAAMDWQLNEAESPLDQNGLQVQS